MSFIIGSGVVTPLASSLAPTWEALLEGRGAIRPITRFDASTFPVRFAAEGPARTGEPAIESAERWLDLAVEEALVGLDLEGIAPRRRGVFLGAEAARPPIAQLVGALDGMHATRETVDAHAPWALLARLARRVGARGPASVISTACTSSGQAVGEAMRAVRRGEVDVAVAAGVDVLVHPLMVAGFARLGALSTRNDAPELASRPFDLERDGFVLGEGAGVLVLASEAVANRIGRGLGRVTGYGCTSNAWRITDSPPDGRGAADAMAAALHDAGRAPADVAWVHAHGTSTKQNDASEAAAIRKVLGSDVAVTSTKGAMGHLVAACGVVGVAIAQRALQDGAAPGTLNLDRPDPACAAAHLRAASALPTGGALVNAFGFGGINASILVERA